MLGWAKLLILSYLCRQQLIVLNLPFIYNLFHELSSLVIEWILYYFKKNRSMMEISSSQLHFHFKCFSPSIGI